MSVDDHGQPSRLGYNLKRNREKALYSLLGLCRGLVADQQLNPREVLFLWSWLENQKILHDDPDGFDLLDAVRDIIKDNKIEQEELEDLQALIENILRVRKITPDEAGAINHLLGVLTGISADHHINTVETQFLKDWLAANGDLKNAYPGAVVYDKVVDVLEDGVVTDREKGELIKLLHSVVGNQFENTGIACGLSTEFCTQCIDQLEHAGRVFCITGKLSLAPRSVAVDLIAERGGVVVSTITKKLDVLVIGELASRDWRFTAHGRKIEKAIELQRDGLPLVIINERTWRKFL